jgi:flagellar biosynthesis/type III secretory pathway M-ring protein FliF/YscJ
MNEHIPVLSLVVTAIAVVVGPWISWRIAIRQIEAAQREAQRQLVGPMRQSWSLELRQHLAELLSSTLHYSVAGFEERPDKEYRRLTQLQQEVTLMLNPHEEEHTALVSAIGQMINALSGGKAFDQDFIDGHTETTRLAQRVLKEEWSRIKKGL